MLFRSEHDVEGRGGEGERRGGAADGRHAGPGLLVEAERVLELAVREVQPVGPAAVRAHPARALARAAAHLEDVETGRRLYVDPTQARADYRRRLDEHTAALESACRRLGSAFQRISTAEPLELALFGFLQARLHRGRLVRRAAAGGRP